MSEEEAPETVTIEKSKLDALLSKVEQLVDKVDKLEHDLEERSQPQVASSHPPVFHSQTIADAKVNRAMREAQQRAEVEHSLTEATEYVIKDYKQNPPKHRQ